ncbi:hypothetical protein TI39_contig424g00011 [Zymoseptoria brevis]|uniref:C3H1-type domain-containing protein n=1 Tax=Zymoseptoria brevis TaxID=1047168 RepID=A0A0F4GLX1_9PEZI|nr:hypothetical protein TI39_contig424g00011 [Zymoseptoria brevis]
MQQTQSTPTRDGQTPTNLIPAQHQRSGDEDMGTITTNPSKVHRRGRQTSKVASRALPPAMGLMGPTPPRQAKTIQLQLPSNNATTTEERTDQVPGIKRSCLGSSLLLESRSPAATSSATDLIIKGAAESRERLATGFDEPAVDQPPSTPTNIPSAEPLATRSGSPISDLVIPPAASQASASYRPSPTPKDLLEQVCTWQVNGKVYKFCENRPKNPECWTVYHICPDWWNNVLDENGIVPPCSFGEQDGTTHKCKNGDDLIHERATCRHWLKNDCAYRFNGCPYGHNLHAYRDKIKNITPPKEVMNEYRKSHAAKKKKFA